MVGAGDLQVDEVGVGTNVCARSNYLFLFFKIKYFSLSYLYCLI